VSALTILAGAWRVLFLTASAPLIGGVLLAAIGRVTGARWEAAMAPPVGTRLVIVGAALLGVSQFTSVPPPHLAFWMNPMFVGVRAVLAAGLLAFAGARLAAGASVTFAAVMLALYAAFVTPVATDWLLGEVPGHAVSSAGMMLFVEQIAGACAIVLVLGRGDARFRGDMAKLMVAAALGLSYLIFMDYVILWFGNLPSRVGFYVDRSTLAGAGAVWVALAAGLVVPIAALTLRAGSGGERIAGATVLVALFVANGWWVGIGIAGGLAAAAGMTVIVAIVGRTRRAHGR
jgi:hypothetical protein